MFTKSNHNIFLLSFTACSLMMGGSMIEKSLQAESLNQKTWFSQAMDSIGQSSFIHTYSQHVQTKIDGAIHTIKNFDDQLASSRYQELGSQAQYAAGIPLERHLPIKKINYAVFSAMTESDAIYVNENNLDKRTYGSQRSTMFHEAIHAKYHDSAVLGMIKQVGFWGGTIGTYAVLKACNVVKLRKSLSVAAGLTLAKYAWGTYDHFMEQRADTQGHYATQCSNCVHEEIQGRKEMLEQSFDIFKKALADRPSVVLEVIAKFFKNINELGGGYLTQAELAKIAQDLDDKKCAYHSKQK